MSTELDSGQGAAPHINESPAPRSLTLRLDGFVSKAILDESARMGVSEEELASFSILYYLADVDSGRIARRRPPQLVSAHAG